MNHDQIECYRKAQALVVELRDGGKMAAVRENYARLHGLDLNNEEDIKKIKALGKTEMIEAIAVKAQENCAKLVRINAPA